MTKHKEILFDHAPDGMPDESCFRLVERDVPEPADGQVLVETHYLSIDPYVRRLMSKSSRYAKALEPGDTMVGRGAGVVIESRHPDFAVGDAVQSEFGWREHVVLSGDGLRKLPDDLKPLSLSLGMVGQSGATAWVGLHDIAHIKEGETVVVSAAAGAVGSAVGQIARIKGCRAVGIAGGPEKCAHVVNDLGFDGCVDYKAGPIDEKLRALTPDGIDIYFDNVGGAILDAALAQLNPNARVPICGRISEYNRAEPYPITNIGVMLDKWVMMQGFYVSRDLKRRDLALDELMQWHRQGLLTYRETVAEGIESAPKAMINMLSGGNIGKQVVRVAAG